MTNGVSGYYCEIEDVEKIGNVRELAKNVVRYFFGRRVLLNQVVVVYTNLHGAVLRSFD